jgi:hypothetical protein
LSNIDFRKTIGDFNSKYRNFFWIQTLINIDFHESLNFSSQKNLARTAKTV